MWHTPHACTFTTASPGPGSGTVIVSMRTGSPLPGATTPRTCCAMAAALPSILAAETTLSSAFGAASTPASAPSVCR
ncbi:hypothetical protein GCM10022214_64550 [Actinomadura miaoliensis]|uniref:Uncharacterized protein n=1 Tax=Actinomadura miaoliensis TaxID=430685 RepID=A0ABP7WPW5_9ACTN